MLWLRVDADELDAGSLRVDAPDSDVGMLWPRADADELDAGSLRVDAPDSDVGMLWLRADADELDAGSLRAAVELDAGIGVLRAEGFAIGSGAGVLGTSTDQPSARPAIRPIVSSPRGIGVDRALGAGVAPDAPRRFSLGSSSPSSPSSSSSASMSGIPPMFGVALRSDGARTFVAPAREEPAVGDRVRPLDSPALGGFVRPLDSPGVGVRGRLLAVGVFVRPLESDAGGDFVRPDSPDAVRAGSVDAGGDGCAGGPDRVGAGVAAGVAAAGGSSLGDSTDQPDARSAMRLLVSSPSRRRVRSSSGTHRP